MRKLTRTDLGVYIKWLRLKPNQKQPWKDFKHWLPRANFIPGEMFFIFTRDQSSLSRVQPEPGPSRCPSRRRTKASDGISIRGDEAVLNMIKSLMLKYRVVLFEFCCFCCQSFLLLLSFVKVLLFAHSVFLCLCDYSRSLWVSKLTDFYKTCSSCVDFFHFFYKIFEVFLKSLNLIISHSSCAHFQCILISAV